MIATSSHEDWCRLPVLLTETELLIGGRQVMQAWERPLMEVLAREVTATAGDILDVGFGMGISANAVMQHGCRSYMTIEAHPVVAANARAWGQQQARPVRVLEGFWQEVVPHLEPRFDGILFDTFPIVQEASHINPVAMIPAIQRLLRPGGVLAYYAGTSHHLPPDQVRLLLEFFDEVKLIKVSGLQPYPGCDYWSESTMVVPAAKKGK